VRIDAPRGESTGTAEGSAAPASAEVVAVECVMLGDRWWWVASERATPIRCAAVGSVKADEMRTARSAPMGRRHAVLADSALTACGRPLVGLHTFPDLLWKDSTLASRNCPACSVEVDALRPADAPA
jgi:hypothetical protein